MHAQSFCLLVCVRACFDAVVLSSLIHPFFRGVLKSPSSLFFPLLLRQLYSAKKRDDNGVNVVQGINGRTTCRFCFHFSFFAPHIVSYLSRVPVLFPFFFNKVRHASKPSNEAATDRTRGAATSDDEVHMLYSVLIEDVFLNMRVSIDLV